MGQSEKNRFSQQDVHMCPYQTHEGLVITQRYCSIKSSNEYFLISLVLDNS